MTDTPPEEPTEPTTDESAESEQPESESPNVKRLREINKTQAERIEALESVARLAAFERAGIDPEKGLGKAIFRTYDGPIEPSAITEFASSEYDWEAPKPNPVSPQQQRMQQVDAMSVPEGSESTLEKADKAAAEGDWVEAQRLKAQQLLALAQKNTGY